MILKDFFIYGIDFTALAPGATATDNIQIQADADFETQKLTYFADIAAAAQTVTTQVIPLITVLITDAGSGRQLMNVATAIPALFGDGKIPFILPTSRIFAARSNITFQVSNFDAAVTYNLRLSLIGTKLFQT
jgi:NAD(P)-dependent dehydrogenase (short-subunit alcohol dehydrogenase family)